MALIIFGCSTHDDMSKGKSFLEDQQFLSQYVNPIVLKSDNGLGQILVIPEYQGRIMTSTLEGPDSEGFGWINYDMISSGQLNDVFNAFGGEDRFWLGPEGGQFSLYHSPGKAFTLENWKVPEPIDTQPFRVITQNTTRLEMAADFSIRNYSGAVFDLHVNRQVRILEQEEIIETLGLSPQTDLSMVGFESANEIRNAGNTRWEKSEGLVSIWILGMFNPGKDVIIILPYNAGGTDSLGTVVNTDYFGQIPTDRLKIIDGLVLFKGDGQYRSKIGMTWLRALEILGSYDPEKQVLTIVKYNKPKELSEYVKAKWDIMDDPYGGDVINSYNDGKPAPDAAPLGPFYELETSSPVKELEPGESISHIHQTFHIKGSEAQISQITEGLFNAKLEDIREGF